MDQLMPATGALVSPVDDRDWTLASVGASTIYPSSCFIDVSFMHISMQSKIGCCVGCTGEEIVRKIIYQLTGHQEDLSFRFVYALCKCLEGTLQPDGSDYRMYPRTAGVNDGTYPALAAKVVRKYGVCLASLCPNDIVLTPDAFCYGRVLGNMPKEAFVDALTRRSGADFTVPITVDGIMQSINYAKENNGGVMILRQIGNTYWTDVNGHSTWDGKKIVPIRPTPVIESGHEEFLYGYDTEPGTGRVRIYWMNHWSKDWALNGLAWEYLDVWLAYTKEIRVIVASVPFVDDFKYHFTKKMQKGAAGAEVVALQHALKLEACFSYPTFTGYYGDLTATAVTKFQEKYKADILTPIGLTHGTGIVGPATLKKLNELYDK